MTARAVTLKNEAAPDKYGIVTLQTRAGELVREYRITGEELRALQSGKIDRPPGCTAEEWTSGRSYVAGVGHEVGDYDQRPDGSIRLMYAETQEGGRIVRHFASIKATAVTSARGQLSLTPEAKEKMAEVTAGRIASKGTLPVLDLVDGVLTYDDGKG
jgi:hypothetical protein